MKAYVIVTGGGSGVGRALTLRLAKQKNLNVLITGRTLRSLKETQDLAGGNIDIVQADIGTEEGRAAIFKALPANANIAFLIHNAAIIEGCELKNVDLNSWRYQMAVNLEGPLFLTQKLLPLLKGARVLNISSGFAHMPSPGISPYCVSKAALHMLYKSLSLELAKDGIVVGSLRPGVVDTPFQEKMRSIPVEVFPAAPKFNAMKKDNALQSPEKIAKFIEWVLFKTEDAKFSEAEWNIADAWHQQEWLAEFNS